MSARDRAIKRVGIENAIVKAHAIGVNEERERIIKLLETAPKDNYFVWGVIAFIKGENK